MKVRENREELVGRIRILSGAMVLLLILVLSGFWHVQIVRGDYFRGLAENNRLRREPQKSMRGLIADRTGKVLVENVGSYNLLLDPSQAKDLESSLAFAAETLRQPPARLRSALERGRRDRPFGAALLAEDLSLEEVTRFGVAAFEHPEFGIQVHHLRLYRHGPQTAHLLGYLAEVTERELAEGKDTYRPGDQVGRRGLEQAYDTVLRGRDGEQVVVVDSRGRPVEEFKQAPPLPGGNLGLTLDLELQQEAYELLTDKVGAVVALDPRDGAVRALASSPSFDPNLFSSRLAQDEWTALVEAEHHPLQNRAIQNTYSPGSVFKLVMATAGLSEHFVSPQDRVFCGGSKTYYGRRFRCWRRAGHGWVDLEAALKASCDIYFYDLGQRLGIQRIARWSRLFGLGTATGIDLLGEKAGLVPDQEWSRSARGTPWFAGETISVAIGQGPLLVTPLQIATMVATVANGGSRVVPHLNQRAVQPPERIMGINAAVLSPVRRALWAVVNEPDGTGRIARIDGLDVAGKTGTVQVVAQETWIDSETLPFEKRDHAWFVSFAPTNAPELVIVVFVEHGGKGSAAAAPIARELYAKYFRSKLDHHRPD